MAHDRQETYNKVITIVAEQLSVPAATVKEDSTLESLGADSLDMVEIVMKVEEECGVAINDEAAATLTTVGQVVDYINQLQNK